MSAIEVRDALGGVLGGFAVAAACPPSVLSDAELMDDVVGLSELAARVEARRLDLVAELHVRGATEAATGLGTVRWLAAHTRVTRRSAARTVKLAGELRTKLPRVAARYRVGGMSGEQVQAAALAVRDVPAHHPTGGVDGLDSAETISHADALLARHAAYLSGDDYAVVARRLGSLITTEAGERSFARQHTGRRLSLSQLLDGSWKLDGLLDAEAGALVLTALDPLCRPRGRDDERTAWQRRADALAEVCAHALNTGQVPARGGVRPHVQILIPADTLLPDDTDAAGTGAPADRANQAEASGTEHTEDAETGGTGDCVHASDGEAGNRVLNRLRRTSNLAHLPGLDASLPPSVWERLTCDCAIRRVILDPAGMPLDVGRATRTATGAQRAALLARDRGCAYPNCHRPGGWTDAHHIRHWRRHHGQTDLANLILLCRHHHGSVHRGDYTITVTAGDHAVFTHHRHGELGRHRLQAGP